MQKQSSIRSFVRCSGLAAMFLLALGCSSKASFVCGKLEGCQLLGPLNLKECIDAIRIAQESGEVEVSEVTICQDCYIEHTCAEIPDFCEEDCAEVNRVIVEELGLDS